MESNSPSTTSQVEQLLEAQKLQWHNLKAELEARLVQSPDVKNDIIYCDCKVIEFENEIALLRR